MTRSFRNRKNRYWLISTRTAACPAGGLRPLLSRAEEVHGEDTVFARVNLGQNTGLAKKYGIQAAPTLILFSEGEEKGRHRGVITEEELEQLLAQ
ncbi:MAG TPA: hypothetical protein DCF42_01035 [Lachnospiraceae bacterium]|nr:hypothetical protein [Lachnospiraceae bacterium]